MVSMEDLVVYSAKENLVITVLYRQPDDSRNGHPSTSKEFIELLENICVKHEENLFNKSNHGFRGGRSCLSQLLLHFDQILSFLERGMNVDTIYLNFSKGSSPKYHLKTLFDWLVIGMAGF